ncbi:MAG: DUF547 domain-containing protein [Bacteroidia bacterium]
MKISVSLLFLLFSLSVAAQQPRDDFFSNAHELFSNYVSKGKVNYAALKKNTALLNRLSHEIETFNLPTAGKNTRQAFYLNAYNILVIKAAAENYPLQSPLNIPGFFDAQTHKIAGEELTLDELEKITIGNEYDDPRIHFWLSKAALGGPVINENALMMYNINDLLDQQMAATVNNSSIVAVDSKSKEVLVPMTFKINESDITRNGKTVLDFINNWREKKITSDFKISYYSFNWDVNDSQDKQKIKLTVQTVVPAAATVVKTTVATTDSTAEQPAVKTVAAEKEPPAAIENASTGEASGTFSSAEAKPEADDILSQGSYMLHSDFQIRTTGTLNTQHAAYNNGLDRVNNPVRTTAFNFGIQAWSHLSARADYGVQFTFRSLVIDDYSSSPYAALSFSNGKNSKVYFRDVTNSIKYLIHDGKSRITAISSFNVPVTKSNVITYGKDTLVDSGTSQWFNQLFYVRNFSKYFTLNFELNGTLRFNIPANAKKLLMRSSLLPEFNYWFNDAFRFYAFFELNPQVNHGFFSNFYFREGAGITLIPGKTAQWDFQYNYLALGKRSLATSSFLFGGRFNF